MKVSGKEVGPCRRVLTITVSPEEIRPHYEAVLREYVARSKLPGFRPGKSPPALVEARFGRRILREVEERTVPHYTQQAFQEQGLRPVAVVGTGPVRLSRETGMEFTVTVDVDPTFELPKYEKIQLKGRLVRVEEKDIAETLQQLRQRFGRYVDTTERPVREGDLVLVDYAGCLDGRPLREVAEDAAGLDAAQDFWMPVQERSLVPGLARALVGMRIGEEREVAVSFPSDFSVSALTGKTAVYQVKLKAIRERVPADLTPEFLRRFEVDSEEALRQRLRDMLQAAREREERARLRNEIARYLLDRTRLDVPHSLLEREARRTVRSLVYQRAREGATLQEIEERKADILHAATTSATERLKLQLILDKIADERGVQVAEEDVTRELEALAREAHVSPAEVRARLEQRQAMDVLRRDIRREKTLEALLELVKVKWEDSP